jgi:hypothetical protein
MKVGFFYEINHQINGTYHINILSNAPHIISICVQRCTGCASCTYPRPYIPHAHCRPQQHMTYWNCYEYTKSAVSPFSTYYPSLIKQTWLQPTYVCPTTLVIPLPVSPHSLAIHFHLHIDSIIHYFLCDVPTCRGSLSAPTGMYWTLIQITAFTPVGVYRNRSAIGYRNIVRFALNRSRSQ